MKVHIIFLLDRPIVVIKGTYEKAKEHLEKLKEQDFGMSKSMFDNREDYDNRIFWYISKDINLIE